MCILHPAAFAPAAMVQFAQYSRPKSLAQPKSLDVSAPEDAACTVFPAKNGHFTEIFGRFRTMVHIAQ